VRGAQEVEGVAVELTCADRSRSLPELIFSCARAALADANCTLQDVDAVTIAAEDLIDGRSLSSMITGPAAGAYLRDEIRVSEDGLAALSLGAAQIQSGMFDRVLVAAWGRASEGDPERSSAYGFDPFTTQLRLNGGRVISWNYVEAIPEQPLGVWFAKGSFLKSNPQAIDGFIKAMKESIDYLHADDSRARAVKLSHFFADSPKYSSYL